MDETNSTLGVPSNPPPPPPIAPPPIMAPPPGPRPRGSVIWKVLAVVFIALFLISLAGNFASLTRALAPASYPTSARQHNLEEVVLQRTNMDSKIAVITVDGVISS